MKYKIKHYSLNKCPDELFGTINIGIQKNSWLTPCNRPILQSSVGSSGIINPLNIILNPNQNIIVVLESPHTSEFDSLGNPICPLNEKGTIFHRLFCKKMDKIQFKNLGNYNVYLINPIQYQCSLGISPICDKIKETNFINFWLTTGENDFLIRMNKLIKSFRSCSDLIIINACAKGKMIPMKKLVEKAIQKLSIYNPNNYFTMSHPASWR